MLHYKKTDRKCFGGKENVDKLGDFFEEIET